MDETHTIRVVVADPHPTMLLTARRLLEADDAVEVVASAGDLRWGVRVAAEREADVLVIDLTMLEGSARAKVAELRRALPGMSIVILTMEAAPAFVPAMIGAGACGYVLKEFAESDLVHAVRQATTGQRFVSAKVAA